MRRINKGAEPPCLANLRRDAKQIEKDTGQAPVNDDWNPGACADAIREALCREQGYLCAYCMQSIEPHGYIESLHHLRGMKIEHFETRKAHPRRMYDWDNLLAVCPGITIGPSGRVFHCDTSRSDKPLHIHPAKIDPNPEEIFNYQWKDTRRDDEGNLIPEIGKIMASTKAGDDDIKTLGLNESVLVSYRKQAINTLRQWMRKNPTKKQLEIRLQSATNPADGRLLPYAPLVARYIERKLRSR